MLAHLLAATTKRWTEGGNVNSLGVVLEPINDAFAYLERFHWLRVSESIFREIFVISVENSSWKSSEMSIAMPSPYKNSKFPSSKALLGLFSNRTFSRKHDFPKTQESRWKYSQTVFGTVEQRKKIINGDVFGSRRREKKDSPSFRSHQRQEKKIITVVKRCLTCKVIGRCDSAGGFGWTEGDIYERSLLNNIFYVTVTFFKNKLIRKIQFYWFFIKI